MKRRLPRTPSEWLKEIEDAIADARETKRFGALVGQSVTDDKLFLLAPLVCLNFRGRKLKGPEANRVTKTALANYVVSTNREEFSHGLDQKPMLAFALCYIGAHLALDLVNEREAEAILNYCEEHLVED